ncbi:hypothetical protein KP509_36G042800 [Ceratopteris richardii]|uniref:Uncharacterized protein n=1 Tax=Ceratopteris richardii TaxID=49495 RepID=A0A8T2QDT6_CERRI|nr:hypothetical protein KP509_36G042800 [Ceratopteris richardii]
MRGLTIGPSLMCGPSTRPLPVRCCRAAPPVFNRCPLWLPSERSPTSLTVPQSIPISGDPSQPAPFSYAASNAAHCSTFVGCHFVQPAESLSVDRARVHLPSNGLYIPWALATHAMASAGKFSPMLTAVIPTACAVTMKHDILLNLLHITTRRRFQFTDALTVLRQPRPSTTTTQCTWLHRKLLPRAMPTL